MISDQLADTQHRSSKDTLFCPKKTLNCRGKIINLSVPAVMGVINVTPDSFFERSRYRHPLNAINKAEALLAEGATILDIGAASTRPGASLISPEDEQKRLIPALDAVLKQFPEAIISVDTYNSATARIAIESGASMINDISAGNIDSQMFSTVAGLQVPYIIMHMRGIPANMQNFLTYNDVTKEVIFFFAEKIDTLRSLGLHDIIIDPGFGFSKSLEQNYRLLADLDYFNIFGLPLLAGLSRKSMINKVLNTTPEEALNGTTVLNTLALIKGASILRVHDAKEASEAIKIADFYLHQA